MYIYQYHIQALVYQNLILYINFHLYYYSLELLSINIKKIMENVIKIKVPLLVEVGYGKTWLEAH